MLTMKTGVNLTGVNILTESFANLIDSAHLALYDEAQFWVERSGDAICGIQTSLKRRPKLPYLFFENSTSPFKLPQIAL